MMTGFGEAFVSGSMKSIIEKNEIKDFSKPQNQKDFKLLKSYLNNGYDFVSVKTRPNGFYGMDALMGMSVVFPDLKVFEKTLSIYLPFDGVEAYFRLKKQIYPSFDKLIWQESKKFQASEMKQVNQIAKETKFSSRLMQAKKFYSSDYPLELDFKVGLIPIPDSKLKKNHTSAQNLKDIQVVPYLEAKGVKQAFDVIFHEFCHALYEAQSRQVKQEIEDFYLNSNHPHASFTYTYLNEILATALGNGWYGQILNPKNKEASWYAVNYIDQMAKAIYPTVLRYLQDSKSIDRAFLLKSIEVAEKTFPKAPFEVDANFLSLRVLSLDSRFDRKTFSDFLQSSFRVQSMSWSIPASIDDIYEIDKPGTQSIIILGRNKKSSLKKLKNVLPEEHLKKIEESDSFLAVFRNKGKYIFWIESKKATAASKALQKLKNLKHLPRKFSVYPL